MKFFFSLSLSILILGCTEPPSQSIPIQEESEIIDSIYNDFMQFHFGKPTYSPEDFVYRLSEKDDTPYSYTIRQNINELEVEIIGLRYNMGTIIFDKKRQKFYADFMHYRKAGDLGYIKNHFKDYVENSEDKILQSTVQDNNWNYQIMPLPAGLELMRGIEKYINSSFKTQLISPAQFRSLSNTYFQTLGLTLLDKKEMIKNEGTILPEKLDGAVEFEKVWFAYVARDYVLKDLSFEIKPGETLAIVGSTGSGKSTIINILNRFYETQKGRIKIDGIDIKEYELMALRQRIAVVLQDVFLFSGSVFENITLRDESISKEKVLEAAKMIGAHEFIEKLPGGYDYEVMERGATLSMGQRQLISFVRALVFDPDILILDEATSSIDPETESVIQYAIEKLIAKRTSIIIAHRLSTIRHANNIMVLDKGEIQEFGSHSELLTIEDGHYKELYEMQFLEV